MKNKIAFWIITLILIMLVVFISVVTVIQPVFTKNSLPKAVVRSSDQKEKVAKDKQAKADKDKVAKADVINSSDDTVSSSDGSTTSNLNINKLARYIKII